MKNFIIWIILISGLAYGGAKLYLAHEVSKGVDMAILMVSPYANVEYDGIGSTLTGELTVDGVRIQVEGYSDLVTIDRIGIDTPSFFSLLELRDAAQMRFSKPPEYFGFLIEGLRMPVGADYYDELYEFALAVRGVEGKTDAASECTGKYGFSSEALRALGYQEQAISMRTTIRNEESRYSFDLIMSMDDMWDMKADVKLAGNMMTDMFKGRAAQPRLNKMHLEFTDRSLNERVTRYCQQLGLSAADTLRAQIDSFKYVGESNGILFDQYMLDPYKEFVLGKSTLVVTAQPTNPVAFSQIDLYKPEDVPALLNLAAIAR